jgi:hypothetical protein
MAAGVNAHRVKCGRARKVVRLFAAGYPARPGGWSCTKRRLVRRYRCEWGRAAIGFRLAGGAGGRPPQSRPGPVAPARRSGTVDVVATPGLYPAFDPQVSDYVVRCQPPSQVALQVNTTGDAEVSVDGAPARRGPFSSAVALHEGQRLSFTADTGSTSTYHVRCLPSDFPNWTSARVGTPEAALYIVSPQGAADNYVMVFDADGVPIWWTRPGAGYVVNAMLLPNGHLAWFWPFPPGAGFNSDPAAGFEERTLGGTLVRKLSTVGSPPDVHELRLLANGNYLMLSYKPRDHVDLSPYGGPSDATVVDGEIQEIDPTGALVWSWNSKDHIALSETGRWYGFRVIAKPTRLPDGRTAYDLVHFNSLEASGNRVVVSARHLDAVFEIDRTTGAIAWKLGGTTTPNSLTIVNDPFESQDFGGQHDARLLPDGTLTLHDNGTGLGRAPRALRFALDTTAKTAALVEALGDPDAQTSSCCGSARRLPGGNWVMSWGSLPLVTELNGSGQRVFRLDFSAGQYSYRADPVLPGTVTRSALRAGMDSMFPR